VFSSDADEVFPRFSTDVVVVLLEGNEEHVHVKGWEIDLVDVEVCYILCERGALRGGEDVGVGIDSPERHGCYLGCLWACKNWLLLCLSRSNRVTKAKRFRRTRRAPLSFYAQRCGAMNNQRLLSYVMFSIFPYQHFYLKLHPLPK
jgi:hypothetical protein